MTKQPLTSPLISVIIPVYNGERFLSEAIESILAQTYREFELIVVDDGSTDRSGEIAASYDSVRCITQPNAGTAAARNHGIRVSRGEYISFLDADDLWMPDKLALQMAAFEADPTLEIVSGHVTQFVDPSANLDPGKTYSFPQSPTPGYVAMAILIKKSALQKTGLFHENEQLGETISWFSEVIDKGQKIFMLPNVVARRRIHGKNISLSSVTEKNHQMLLILKKSIERKRQSLNDK